MLQRSYGWLMNQRRPPRQMKISSLPNITITTIIITTGAGITIIITTIATDRRDLFASYNQMKKGSAPALPFFLRASRAFSSEVDTGSREENASKQKIRAWF